MAKFRISDVVTPATDIRFQAQLRIFRVLFFQPTGTEPTDFSYRENGYVGLLCLKTN